MTRKNTDYNSDFNQKMSTYFNVLIGEVSIKSAALHLKTTPSEIISKLSSICDRNLLNRNSIISWKDKNSVYLGYNKNAFSFFPKTPPSLIGFTDYHVASKEYADLYCAYDAYRLKNNAPMNFEGPVVHPSLGVFHAEGASFQLIDDNGNAQGIILASNLTLRLKDMPFARAIGLIQGGLVHLFIKKKTYIFAANNFDISFSAKECECLLYAVAGKTAKDIAHYTHSSPRTIEGHLENARLKLNCSYKSEMVDKLIDLDFISRF